MDQWNQAREAREREAYYLSWLEDSLEESIVLSDDAIASLARKTENAYGVAERMRLCDLDPAEADAFEQRFLAVGPWSSAVFIDSALTELRATGTSDVILHPALQRQLARFETAMRSDRESIEFLKRMLADSNIRRIERFDRHAENGVEQLVSSYEDLCADAVLRRQIRWHGGGYAALARFSEAMRDRMVHLRDRLQQAR